MTRVGFEPTTYGLKVAYWAPNDGLNARSPSERAGVSCQTVPPKDSQEIHQQIHHMRAVVWRLLPIQWASDITITSAKRRVSRDTKHRRPLVATGSY